MRQTISVALGLAAILALVGCSEPPQEPATTQEPATDSASESSNTPKAMIFENDYVKVMEIDLKPGEELPLHKGDPRAVYSLSDYKIRWTEGGETSEKEWKEGDAHWHDAIEHAVENIGDNDARFLVVARREKELPETGDYDISQDASVKDSEHSKLVFENEHVRVIKTVIPPQTSQVTHQGVNRLVYALSDYEIKYTSDTAGTKQTKLAAGSAHWHEADEHSVENVGATPAEFLIFAFKK